jgi:hypothetical protein
MPAVSATPLGSRASRRAQLAAHRSEGKAKDQAIAQLQAQNDAAMLMLVLAAALGRGHVPRKVPPDPAP